MGLWLAETEGAKFWLCVLTELQNRGLRDIFIAAVDGLRWKVWLMNEDESEAGGIYLFEDSASLDAYLNGPIMAGVSAHPALSGFSVKRFDVMEALTAVTRGPVRELTLAQRVAVPGRVPLEPPSL